MFPNKFYSNNNKSVFLITGILLTIIVILFIFALINNTEENGIVTEGEGLLSDGVVDVNNADMFQVNIIEEGQGYKSKIGDIIVVHYTGKLKDGTVFDSSVTRGEPFSFEVGAGVVILGWDIGLLDISEGSRLIITIPPDLAYGSVERPGIPANSVLIFEVEVLGIEKASQ